MFRNALLFSLISVSLAHPFARFDEFEVLASNDTSSNITDIDVLQYALTLEHLENAFYSGGLEAYNASAFEAAGFPDWVRNRFVQIGNHEATHVAFLTEAISANGTVNATEACEYDFPYSDPTSFVELSKIFEGVGVAAYIHAAKYITDKDYLTAAASILAVEARHSAWVSSAVMTDAAWDTAFDTPLSFDGVYSLAAPFISSCPSTNPILPVTILPNLTLSTSTPGNDSFTVTFNDTFGANTTYLAYFSGFDVKFSAIADNLTTAPDGFNGSVYAGVVASNTTSLSNTSLLTGLAYLEFPNSV